jgi:hypothetical protein
MKKEILAEQVDQIIQQSFWGKGGLKLTESSQDLGMDHTEATGEQDEQGHVCPLCEHVITGPISDEQLTEHIELMLSVIQEVSDISDEEIDAIQEAIEDELSDESDDDSEDESDDDSEDEDSEG